MRCIPFVSMLAGLLSMGFASGAAAQVPLPATINLAAPADAEGTPVWRIFGASTEVPNSDSLLRSLATGDFDGDGYDDLLVAGGRNAYIVYGVAGVLPNDTSLSAGNVVNARGATRISTDELASPFAAVAAGDFNGDGLSDAVVCDASHVYIVYGDLSKPGTPSTNGSLVEVTTSGAASAAGETRIEIAYELIRPLLAVGDMNGDGFDDLVIGDQNAGIVRIIYGTAAKPGTPNGPGTAVLDAWLYVGGAGGTVILNLPTPPDAMAVGDVDGDGYDDLALGVGLANVPGSVDAGVVILLHGRAQRLGTSVGGNLTVDLTSASVAIPSNNGETRILGDDLNDQLGTSLAMGDVDGDGFADLLMGAPLADSNTLTNNGEVVVLHGAAIRPGTPVGAGHIVDLNTNGAISAAGETRVLGAIDGAALGTSVSDCDFNGDGLSDLVLGSPQENGGAVLDAGVVRVVYGRPDRHGVPSGTGRILNLFNEAADVEILGPTANALLGGGLQGAGDVNLDGFADLMGSAVRDPKSSNVALGSVTIIYGGGDAAAATAKTAFAAGATPVKGLGGVLSPVLRTQLQFDDGDAGTAAMVLTREGTSEVDLPPGYVMPQMWQLTVDRPGWSQGSLTLQFTRAERNNVSLYEVGLWTAPSPEGPWGVPDHWVNFDDYTVHVNISEEGYFLLAANMIPVTISQAVNQSDPAHALPIAFTVDFQNPVEGLSAEDFVFTGTADVSGAELTGSGELYTLKVFGVDGDGTVQPELPAGAAGDADGRRNAQSRSEDNVVGFGGYPPVLSLAGGNPFLVDCQESFVEPGVTAVDGLEGDLSGQVQWVDGPQSGDPSSFTRTYTVEDSQGHESTAFRTVILTDAGPPLITRNGSSVVDVACGEPYVELGATAIESCSELPLAVQTYNPVDTLTPGDYVVLYRATDSLGRVEQRLRTVRVRDLTAPAIALNGEASVTVECRSGYTDPGATAQDACDGDLTGAIVKSGQVNVDVPGLYTLRYKVLDSAGNEAAQLTRSVQVVDQAAPLMSLLGGPFVQIACGAALDDPGVLAVDACAGDLGGSVFRWGLVDTGTPGDYPVQYALEDDSRNDARPVYRTFHVVDNAPPVIALNGDASMVVDCHAAFNDPGAVAMDACEGDVSGNILVTGSVDTETPGTYTLTYAAMDGAGNVAEKVQRQVVVEDQTAPVVTLLGEASIVLGCGEAYTDAGATAEDACEGDLSGALKTYNSVDTAVAGDYVVVYTASDAAGYIASATRTVIVTDTTSPVIAFAGIEATACTEGPATGADLCYTATVECSADLDAIMVTSQDACDGEVELLPRVADWASTEGTANFQQRYTAEDAAGNAMVFDLEIVVADTTPPVLTLVGPLEVTWSCGITYFDAGFTARDACDGDLKEQVVVSGLDALDAITPGDYTISYSVFDAAGNEATATRLVHVEAPCRGPIHSADTNEDGRIQLSELQRVAQFYNIGGYHCALAGSEDGYTPGVGEDQNCNPHNADYDPQDWANSLSELLRMIQFYQAAGYYLCGDSEDGYCPILAD